MDQQGLDLGVSDSSAESRAKKKDSPTEPDSKSAAKPVTGKAEKSSSEAAAVPQVSGFAKASFDNVGNLARPCGSQRVSQYRKIRKVQAVWRGYVVRATLLMNYSHAVMILS